MQHDTYSDGYLSDILTSVKTIAMVGASTNWNRPSYFVMKYLQSKGYRVIPVNPGVAGQELLGETVFARLEDIPDPVDMVDVFRNAEAAGWVEIDPPGVHGRRFRPTLIGAGPERDAVIRATWTQQPFPANLLYRAARRHVAAVGIYHRLDAISIDEGTR